jgi:hypothetical protein
MAFVRVCVMRLRVLRLTHPKSFRVDSFFTRATRTGRSLAPESQTVYNKMRGFVCRFRSLLQTFFSIDGGMRTFAH